MEWKAEVDPGWGGRRSPGSKPCTQDGRTMSPADGAADGAEPRMLSPGAGGKAEQVRL